MSNKVIGDIDIDTVSRTPKSKYGVRAIQYVMKKHTVVPHASGYYLGDVPIDGVTGMSTMDYKDMEASGFTKIDLLNNSSYDVFKSKDEVLEALHKDPDWTLLLNERFVKGLPHLAGHHELLSIIKPTSIMELADVLALIRPAKMKYIDKYIENPDSVRQNLYRKAKEGYWIRKSHAVAYAHMIVCVMNKKDSKGLLTYG